MRRILIWIGWAATLPGFVLATALGVTLAGLPQAAGCVPTRLFAVRCPDSVAGNALRDLYDLGMIALFTLPLSIVPPFYAFGFALFRFVARSASAPERA